MGNKDKNSISKGTNILLNILFIFVAVCSIYPLLLVLGISLSTEDDLSQFGYSLLPHHLSLHAYEYTLKTSGAIVRAYGLTILITVLGTVLCSLITALYAYAISRKEFKYRNTFSFIAFFTMLFSGGLVPWYIVCVRLVHINNTIWALLLPYLSNAFFIMILRTFFRTSIPDSIYESAKIDGAGEFRIFFSIILPLAKPGLATVALFSTMIYWNDWWLPFILINNKNLQNVQYMLYKILNNLEYLKSMVNVINSQTALQDIPSETARMAMCVISVGPIIFAYPFFQKYYIKGLTIGAVKG